MKTKYLLTLLFTYLFITAKAQVGPFINNTLNTAATEITPTNELQVQFAPEVAWATKTYDSRENSQQLDTLNVESGIGLQFNNGITSKLDWGIAFPLDVSEVSVGFKYLLTGNEESKLQTALGTWVDIPTFGTEIIRGKAGSDNIALAGLGAIFQYHASDKLIIYSDLYGQKFLKSAEEDHKMNFYYNLDLDYALSDDVRAAVGFAYSNSVYEEAVTNEHLGTFSYGFFFEKWETWNFYVAHYFDMLGQNAEGGNVFTINITRTFK